MMTDLTPLMDEILDAWHDTETDEVPGGDEYDIIEAFGTVPTADLLPYLMHPGNGYRAVAVAAIGCCVPDEDIPLVSPVLYELMSDSDSWVRDLAFWALAKHDPRWHLYRVWDALLLVLELHLAKPQQMRLF